MVFRRLLTGSHFYMMLAAVVAGGGDREQVGSQAEGVLPCPGCLFLASQHQEMPSHPIEGRAKTKLAGGPAEAWA